jgi:hypothetical protein
MAKKIFLPGIIFFSDQQPREVNEFVSITVVLPMRTLYAAYRRLYLRVAENATRRAAAVNFSQNRKWPINFVQIG